MKKTIAIILSLFFVFAFTSASFAAEKAAPAKTEEKAAVVPAKADVKAEVPVKAEEKVVAPAAEEKVVAPATEEKVVAPAKAKAKKAAPAKY